MYICICLYLEIYLSQDEYLLTFWIKKRSVLGKSLNLLIILSNAAQQKTCRWNECKSQFPNIIRVLFVFLSDILSRCTLGTSLSLSREMLFE